MMTYAKSLMNYFYIKFRAFYFLAPMLNYFFLVLRGFNFFYDICGFTAFMAFNFIDSWSRFKRNINASGNVHSEDNKISLLQNVLILSDFFVLSDVIISNVSSTFPYTISEIKGKMPSNNWQYCAFTCNLYPT